MSEDLEDEEVDEVFMKVIHTMLHEIGHALIDVNGIDIQGVNEGSKFRPTGVSDSVSISESVDELAAVAAAYIIRSEEENVLTVQREHLPDMERGMDYLSGLLVLTELMEISE